MKGPAKLPSVESVNKKMHELSHTVFTHGVSKKTLKTSPRKPLIGGPKKGKSSKRGD